MKILDREVKPCPFCGNATPSISFVVESDAVRPPFVKHLSVSCCADVDIDVPTYYEYDNAYMSGCDALDMWNERTPKIADVQKGDEIE